MYAHLGKCSFSPLVRCLLSLHFRKLELLAPVILILLGENHVYNMDLVNHQYFFMDKPTNKNFITNIIDNDNNTNKFSGRVHTRFPPEPNGYLHIGHAKSICLNFEIANLYNGVCNLRFDDTNPEKENIEYIEAIKKDIEWLGYKWNSMHYSSDYFEKIYKYALSLIENNFAYVDSSSPEVIKKERGTLTEPGTNSKDRDRTIEENIKLFNEMKEGNFSDGEYVLRLKINMLSPNINMRDPVIYRIKKFEHHRTGNDWCIYPMYDFTHCISDAIEKYNALFMHARV